MIKEFIKKVGILRICMILILILLTALFDSAARYYASDTLNEIKINIFGGPLVVAMICIILHVLFSYICQRLNIYLCAQFNWNKQLEIEQTVINRPLETVRTPDNGKILNILQSDIRNIVRFYTRVLEKFLPSSFYLLITLILLFSFHWSLGIAGIILSIAPFFYMDFLSKSMDRIYGDYFLQLDETVSLEKSILYHIDSVKMYLMETQHAKKHLEEIKKLNGHNKKAVIREMILSMPALLFSFISMIVLASISGALIILGEITIAEFFAVVLFIDNIIDPGMMFNGTITSFKRAKKSSDRISKNVNIYAADNSDIVMNKQPDVTVPIDRIVVDSLRFSYSKDRSQIVKINNCCFRRGRINLLSGDNGVGKSTFFALITKTYADFKGEIYLECGKQKHILNEITKEQTNELIAACPQETVIYPLSIQENLLCSNDSDTQVQHKMDKYLYRFGLDEELKMFPEGLATKLYDNGKPLSGGQRKRIAVIRTLLQDSPIMLFDESDASFSGKARIEFWQTLQELADKKIIIVITHEKVPENIPIYTVNLEKNNE